MKWWKNLWARQKTPPMPPQEDDQEVNQLRGGLRVRMRRETDLIGELRRIEVEMRRRGQ